MFRRCSGAVRRNFSEDAPEATAGVRYLLKRDPVSYFAGWRALFSQPDMRQPITAELLRSSKRRDPGG
ncbi:hypothetical protein KCP69_24900 [Salmonella enterica subsp. enterica]|nr:hypothetical protein KCP69_24900 [Salmonella enterica subsp. enterica]